MKGERMELLNNLHLPVKMCLFFERFMIVSIRMTCDKEDSPNNELRH